MSPPARSTHATGARCSRSCVSSPTTARPSRWLPTTRPRRHTQTASSCSPTAGSTAPSTTPTRTRLPSASPISETDMLSLAILTARKRLGPYVGAFLALFGSAVLVMAGGMLLDSALRSHAPVTRYAAAAAVVTGHQAVGPDADVILGEPVRISSALVHRLAVVPGVRAAVADDAVPGRLGAHDVQAHGW